MKRLVLVLTAFLLSGQVLAQNVKTYIPPAAFEWLPVIHTEVQRVFSCAPSLGYFGGLGEQESCISLKHSKCWNTHSTLKTDRELGVGLFQITKAYRKDGTVRFDTLSDLRNKYRSELKDLSWDNVATRGDLQIRAMVLLVKDVYDGLYMVTDPMERLKMTDSGYNQGLRAVYNDRQLCGLTKGCNPQRWFDNVEKTSSRAGVVIYGARTAESINREHVSSVFKLRLPKYDNYYQEQGLILHPAASCQLSAK